MEIIQEKSPGVTPRTTTHNPRAEGNSRRASGYLYVNMLNYGAKDGSGKNNIYLIYSSGNQNLNVPEGSTPSSQSKTDHKKKN